MSRLLVVTRPELLSGFALAGVEVFPAPDVESAVDFINELLSRDEACLLAIDDGLLEKMDPTFIRRLEASEQMPFLAIPGGQGAEEVLFRRRRISELTRRTIGFHSIFKTEKEEPREK